MKRQKNKKLTAQKIAVLAALVLLLVFSASIGSTERKTEKPAETTSQASLAPEATEQPEKNAAESFEPHSVEQTEPEKLIAETYIEVNGEQTESYESSYDTSFGQGGDYTQLNGITAFRGDNFRSGAAFGTAKVSKKTLSIDWAKTTSGMGDTNGNYWSGSGWTGQPIVVQWPEKTRKNISAMYDWAREKDGLVEVIYATMGGRIYFYDLDSGEYTREPMYLGFTFKGAGSLDPRGYPIMYVGAGVDSPNGSARAFVINLLDNSVMYEFGKNESFAKRNWNMFDASPLVCAQTDQLIYPGENGLLYIIHLNTDYDEQAGTLSVDPDEVVKWEYVSERSKSGNFWLGMESSPVAFGHYIFMADNGGHLMCLDLKTIELVWVQDILDDTNCSPVMEIEDGHPYIYISTAFHYGWRSWTTAPVPVWKIDAETGEVVWRTDYDCHTVEDLSGGVQGTIALGKGEQSNMIFIAVARYPSIGSGYLAALDKETGEEIWHLDTQVYSWSSPLDFYDEDGNGYLIYCTSGYYMYLIDAATGEVLDHLNLGGNIEASAVIYNNRIVIGHRSERVYGIDVE